MLVVHTQGQFSGSFELIRGKKYFSIQWLQHDFDFKKQSDIYEMYLLLMKPSDGLQNGSFNIKTQNLELVNLKCAIFTQPVILSLKGLSSAGKGFSFINTNQHVLCVKF